MAGRAEKILVALREEALVREEAGKLVFGPDADFAVYIHQEPEMLAIGKVTSVALKDGLLRITTGRDEVYVFEADALVGFRIQSPAGRSRERGAGFV